MNIPTTLKYTKDHEWISLEGTTATIGITDFAQGELGDIVYVDIDTVDASSVSVTKPMSFTQISYKSICPKSL